MAGLCAAAPLAQQAPAFRSRVDVVTVDVTVVDGGGRLVDTLTAADFRLEVDGAPRRVLSADYVPYRTAASGAPASDAAAAISNEEAATGRLLLLAVDQGNIRRTEGRVALRAAGAFLNTLDPADRVAAVGIDEVRAISFTSDHAAVRRSLAGLTGRAVDMAGEHNLGIAEALAVADGNRSRLDQVVLRECGEPLGRLQNLARMAGDEGMRDPCPTHVEQQARMLAHNARSQGAQSLDALKRLLLRLADLEGPKTLVLLSEGLIAEPQLVDMTDLAVLAQQARASIYVLQLDSPVTDAAATRLSPTLADDFRVRADGLARVAGAGGGALYQLVGTDPSPFARLLRELAGYYLLAFEVAPSDRDGRAHRINVRVARPGVTVRARPAFRAAPAPTAPPSIEDRLVQLLRAARLVTELPLRVAVVNGLAGGGAIRSVIVVEAGTTDDDVTYAAVIVDDKGLVVTSSTARSTTGRHVFPAALAPGRYLLRAAAIGATGREGTVERVLEARLPSEANGMRWSDLTLAEPAAAPGQAGLPIAGLTRSARIAASIEIYADGPAVPLVRFELNAAGGGAAARQIDAAPSRQAPGTWTAGAEFDLGDLPAGRYVVTARLPHGQSLTRPFVLVK